MLDSEQLVGSIQFRFTVIVVLVSAAFFSAMGYWNYHRDQTEKLAAVQAQTAAMSGRLSVSLTDAVWQFNQEIIQQIVDGEMGASNVVGLRVADQHGPVYGVAKHNGQRIPFTNPPASDIHIPIELTRRIAGGGQRVIGAVDIYISLAEMNRALGRDLLLLLAEFSGVCLALILAMFFTMRRIVLRPLNGLALALEHIASADADLSLRLPPSGFREFARVTRGFNQFIAKLQASMGGSIDTVQQAIARVARGELASEIEPSQSGEHSIMGRLAVMQVNLRHYQAQEQSHAQALQDAVHAAQAASQAKSDFLANMSHEIRTPMNAIIGLSNLALKNAMSPRTRDHLQKIRQSGEHLLGIINDILDFSRIESGKLAIESIPFTLQDLIRNVVNLLGEKVEAKRLELRCSVAPDVPQTLLGDPLRLGQVLINLVGNAVKFTASGAIQLDVTVEKRLPGAVLMHFQVSDTGIGLKPEQIERLFTSFVQADTSITRQYGGTGLGLAISKNLVEAMGGRIGVQSDYGTGSTFWFTVLLGLTERPAQAEPSPGPVRAAPVNLEGALACIAGARILLVEDNEINQEVACEILQDAGLEVEVAENGQVAVQSVAAAWADERPYDLLLMDMQMPVMDGVTATRLLRETYSAQALPIVAMTANAMQADRERCLGAGMNGFITKPVNPQDLFEALLRWVRPGPASTRTKGIGVTAIGTPDSTVPATGEPAAEELMQSLSQIAELDCTLGLQCTTGNPAFYATVLKKFVASHAGTAQRIQSCLLLRPCEV
jgi:signal transduction histidine kinase/BarA-like signal transduction histidine kinase